MLCAILKNQHFKGHFGIQVLCIKIWHNLTIVQIFSLQKFFTLMSGELRFSHHKETPKIKIKYRPKQQLHWYSNSSKPQLECNMFPYQRVNCGLLVLRWADMGFGQSLGIRSFHFLSLFALSLYSIHSLKKSDWSKSLQSLFKYRRECCL